MFPYGTDQGDRDLATENGDYLMLDLPEPLPIYTSSHSDDDGVKKLAVSALICKNYRFKDSKFIPTKNPFTLINLQILHGDTEKIHKLVSIKYINK